MIDVIERTHLTHVPHFQHPVGGQRQRRLPGNWERATNGQQKKLVRTFDDWSADLNRELKAEAAKGATPGQLSAILDKRIPDLEKSMLDVTNQGIIGATRISAKSRAGLPIVQAVSRSQIEANSLLVMNSLIPKIHEGLMLPIARGLNENPTALKESLEALRFAPAQYAGGYWVAIFEVQKALGGQREAERASLGLAVEPIRWVLDPNAEHCKPTPEKGGFYGCPELAREYPHWSAIPTVPGGHVTCRGNCRCHLEVYRDGEWRRGVYAD